MSGLFGSGGSSKGTPEDVNVAPFESAGGVTPQQQDYGQFTLGQDLTGQAALFGGSGTGMSTMATQGAGGARDSATELMTSMSDTDQGAEYNLYSNDLSSLAQQLQNSEATNTSPNTTPVQSTGFGVNPGASLT